MKKLNISFIFFFIFFYSFSISAQSNIQDYLKIEKNRLHKADSIESNVKKFISKKINSFQLSSESITEITKIF